MQVLDRYLRDRDFSARCPFASGLDDRFVGLDAPCLLRLSRDPASRSLEETLRLLQWGRTPNCKIESHQLKQILFTLLSMNIITLQNVNVNDASLVGSTEWYAMVRYLWCLPRGVASWRWRTWSWQSWKPPEVTMSARILECHQMMHVSTLRSCTVHKTPNWSTSLIISCWSNCPGYRVLFPGISLSVFLNVPRWRKWTNNVDPV